MHRLRKKISIFNRSINDLLADISPHVKYALYADDIVIWCDLPDLEEAKEVMKLVLDRVGKWQDSWGSTFSPTKSNYVLFTRKRKIPNIQLTINGVNIPSANSVFFLGLKFDKKLIWHEHVKYLFDSCHKRLNVLRSIQHHAWGADRYSIILIYKAYIRAKL